MKKTIIYSFLPLMVLMLSSCGNTAKNNVGESDSTGLAGDHFSLSGALEIFKNSKTLEEFEKSLNSGETPVNNLDLNNDGKVDYVRVMQLKNGDLNAVVLQVPVNATETQDVAVIEMERIDGKVSVQIIGDEALYGKSVILEPGADKKMQASLQAFALETKTEVAVVNVVDWPIVQTIYAPAAPVYVSPYRYDVYPTYYTVRQPVSYVQFREIRRDRNAGFVMVETHRAPAVYQLYSPNRKTSMFVIERYKGPLENFRLRKAKDNDDDNGKDKSKMKDGDHNDDGHPDRGNEKEYKDKDKNDKDGKNRGSDNDKDDDKDDDRDKGNKANKSDKDDNNSGKGKK